MTMFHHVLVGISSLFSFHICLSSVGLKSSKLKMITLINKALYKEVFYFSRGRQCCYHQYENARIHTVKETLEKNKIIKIGGSLTSFIHNKLSP